MENVKTLNINSSSSQNLNLLALQLFIGVMSCVVCLLSITIRQRQEVEARVKETVNTSSLSGNYLSHAVISGFLQDAKPRDREY